MGSKPTDARPASHSPSRGFGARPLARAVRLGFVEARPAVQAVFLLRLTTAAAPGLPSPGYLFAAVSWLATTYTVYLVNGIADVTEDRHNHAGRPLASGALSRPLAWRIAGAGALLAAGCGALTGWAFLVAVLVFLALGYGYSMPPLAFKRTAWTACAVVLLGGLTTYAAGLLAVAGHAVAEVATVAVAMSVWMAAVGALSKDFADVAGDRAARRRTAVIVWGPRRTAVAVAVLGVAVAAGFGVASALVAPRLGPAAIIVCAGAGWLTWSCARIARGASGRGRLSSPYRIYMVTQYGAHAAAIASFLLLSNHGG